MKKSRPTAPRPVGSPTRGTTNPNRLRRVDRWLSHDPRISSVLHNASEPLIVDLGYGATPITTVEMAHRLKKLYPSVHVTGLELDTDRVTAAAAVAEPPWLTFRHGGFELAGLNPDVVRAFNVLRQYAEEEVDESWQRILMQVRPGGFLVDGTCDEIGRLGSWLTVGHDGAQSLTMSCRLSSLEKPSIVAERLPKKLIHRNVPGERIYEFLSTLDYCWNISAPRQVFGARARWIDTIQLAIDRGWPIYREPRRWRLGELTIDYHAIAPQR